MNLLTPNLLPPAATPHGSQPHPHTRGLTLPEMMITVSLLMLVVAAILTTHLFGMRFFEITKAKLVASDDARRTLSRLLSEIRGAKVIQVGNGSLSSFTPVADGQLQRGTAIQVYPTTNLNEFVRYYWSSEGKLRRTTNGATSVNVMASSVTNSTIFSSEDFSGNVLTNSHNNRVIAVNLHFQQLQYPIVNLGPGYYYDQYQMRLRITRRALE